MERVVVNRWSVVSPDIKNLASYVTCYDERHDDGRGCVCVEVLTNTGPTIVETFTYGNAADYDNHERDTLRVHLSALGYACAVGHRIAEAGSLWHIPRANGGFR